MAAGLINNNHMDNRLFELMMTTAKKNALIVFAARFSYIGDYWYDEPLAKYQRENRLRLLDTEDFFKYDKISYSIGRFSRTPARVFVLQNLIDCKTYQVSLMIFKLLRQAIYKQMVVKKKDKYEEE